MCFVGREDKIQGLIEAGNFSFGFPSAHDTRLGSIYPRIQSSLPAKQVNSDWVRVCSQPYQQDRHIDVT